MTTYLKDRLAVFLDTKGQKPHSDSRRVLLHAQNAGCLFWSCTTGKRGIVLDQEAEYTLALFDGKKAAKKVTRFAVVLV